MGQATPGLPGPHPLRRVARVAEVGEGDFDLSLAADRRPQAPRAAESAKAVLHSVGITAAVQWSSLVDAIEDTV